MEIFSWIVHKYVMHGILWRIHKTHHLPGKSFFEWNDLFSLIFGIIAVLLILSGIKKFDYSFWVGVGIAAYGLLYFILHDVIVHQRVTWKNKLASRYLNAVIRAHKMHHKHLHKDGSESFGLLWVSRKYFK